MLQLRSAFASRVQPAAQRQHAAVVPAFRQHQSAASAAVTLSHCTPASCRGAALIARAKRATPEDEKEILKMQKQAEQGDIWESDALSIVVKVLVVLVAGAAVVAIISLGKPVIDNTINSFPRT